VAPRTTATDKRAVEGDEVSAVRDCQREQVGVGDLTWVVQPRAVHDRRVEHADVAGPERMVPGHALG
jgi:hypothetical protein